jgi:hypothetical protein
MGKISADNVLFTFGMFAILMVAFGQTIPSADVQNNMNQLFAGWPTFQQTATALSGPIKTCSSWDWGCQAAIDVAHATAFVGAAIAYPGVLAGSALSRITSFGNLLSFVTFGSATAFGTVPFGFLFLLALFIVVAVEMFRLFRGSPSGL